ncbi:MAG: hypothetical protein R3B41_00725 [Candidatus Doudnabacteria bacterium]
MKICAKPAQKLISLIAVNWAVITLATFMLLFFISILPKSAEAAITFKSEGSLDTTGLSQHLSTPVYPAGTSAGDLLILIIAMKPQVANSGSVTTPAGWDYLGEITGAGGYGTTNRNDTGNTNIFVYYRIADGTGRDSRLAITLANDNVSWATINVLGGTAGGWDVAMATGSDVVGDASASLP